MARKVPISLTLVSLFFILAMVATTSRQDVSAQHVQETPTTTKTSASENICTRGGVQPSPRGRTIEAMGLAITLPPGNYVFRLTIADFTGDSTYTVCYVEGNSSITFGRDGQERSRTVSDPKAVSVLDQIAASVRSVSQPTATPTPTANTLCVAPANATGGQVIGSEATVRVNLPSTGDYWYIFIPVDGPTPSRGVLLVCHIQTDSRIGISADTCRETGRTVNNPAGHAVLDQIVASARCVSPTAKPASTATSPRRVSPPDTGSAGIR